MSETPAETPAELPVEAPKPLRLLLVEDSENDAILLLRELRRGGYDPLHQRVDTPEDMKAALEAAEERGEGWEIVISDYYMPRFRAPAALSLLRRLGYETPFIVVSGKVGEDLAVELMRAGAHDYITKENMARLNPAVERELREAEVRQERGRAREALERSERRFRRLVEQAADAMFVHDLEGRFVDVNRQACESLGYAREELLEMCVQDVEVDYRPGSLERMWQKISAGSPLTIEGRHRRADGSTFPVEVRVGVFEDEERPLLIATIRDITERKEAEKQLQEAETRFRTLVEQIPAITYVEAVDYEERSTTLLYVSPQIEAIFGYSAEEWMADPGLFPRLLHPEDRERVLDEDALTDETGEPFKVEYRQFTRDGQVVWVQDEASLVRDAEGRPLYWQGVVFDITDRKRAEEDLRLRDRAISASSNGIVITDPHQPDNPMIYVNPAFERMTGYSAEEALGRNCRFLQGADRDQPVLDELRRALRSERHCTVVVRNYKKDGTLFYNELSISPVRDEGGKLTHFIGVQNDVTGRKRAEDALRESEERFRSLVRNASDIVAVLDAGGNIVYESPAVERIMGYRPEERIGKNVFDLVHPEDADRISGELAKLLGDPEYRPAVEYRAQAKDGAWRHFEAVGSNLLGDPSVRGIVVNSRDVTERRQAEEELRRSEKRYRTLFETMTQGIVYQDAEGAITSANPAAEKILGLTLDQMQGRTSMDPRWRTIREDGSELPGDEHPTMVALRTGTRVEKAVMGVYVPEEEAHRWISLSAIPQFRPGEDEPYQVYAIFEDITARKRTEQALRESEERYRTFIAQSTEGILRFELEEPIPVDRTEEEQIEHFYRHGYLAECNDAMARMYGFSSAEEVLGARMDDLLPRSIPENEEFLRAGIRHGYRLVDAESRELDRWGRPRYFLNNLTGIIEDGYVVRAWGTQRDITEQRRAEEALRQSEELYRTVVEQAAENIFLVDVGTKRILECNNAFRESLGYTDEDVSNLTLYDFVVGDRESIDENTRHIVEKGKYYIGERQYRRKDGTLVDVEVSVSTVSLNGGPAMCVVAHDITGRKRAEEALEEVRETERNRIARDLHDDILQDIVYALQETQIMQAIASDGRESELEGVAEALRRSVEGLRGAIFDLRLEGTLKQSFMVSLQYLVDLNRRMSRKRYGVELVVEEGFPDDVPDYEGRETIRIIQEALNNVRRHADPGKVRITLGGGNDHMWVEVADDGRGFDPATFAGGVGQQSMRQRAAELGGKLRVTSAPGEGTTVRFEIPLPRVGST